MKRLWLILVVLVSFGVVSAANVSCGYNVNESIVLSEDLDCDGDEYGLVVDSDNVIIDCNGFEIYGGEGEVGIYSLGFSNVTIRNCSVTSWRIGVHFYNSIDNTIRDSHLYENGWGVRMHNTVNVRVLDSRIEGNENSGVYADIGGDNMIKDNVIRNNSRSEGAYYGVRVENEGDLVLEGNDVSNNSHCTGIYLYGVESSSVVGNVVSWNEGSFGCEYGAGGIYLEDSFNVNIDGNRVEGNGYNGISVGWSEENVISDNVVVGNNHYGIRLSSGQWNEVSGNSLINNSDVGIRVSETDSVVVGNVVLGDGSFKGWSKKYSYGIRIGGGQEEIVDSYFGDNFVSGYYYGIHMKWVSDVVIDDSRVEENWEGMVIENGVVSVRDMDFEYNDFEGGFRTGLYVDDDSVVNLVNGNFVGNGEYGIESLGLVYWLITEDVSCVGNDIDIFGWIVPFGGAIVPDNCYVSVNARELDFEEDEQGFYEVVLNDSVSEEVVGGEWLGFEVGLYAYSNLSGGLSVIFYDESPVVDGSSFKDFGKWVDVGLSEDANISWWMLKIYYSEDELVESRLNESGLVIRYYNESDGEWEVFEGAVGGVNETGNYVWANVSHFSLFGVFGEFPSVVTPPVVPPSSGGGGGGGGCIYNQSFDWGCGEWGECVDGIQAKVCKEKNNCGSVYGRPNQTRACSIEDKGGAREEERVVREEEKEAERVERKGLFSRITGAVTGVGDAGGLLFVAVFILSVIGVTGFVYSKKRQVIQS